MDPITVIAPQGNLTIAVGEGDNTKLVKVLSVVLQLVSPVFEAMLGPNFREGCVQYTTTNPLRLPADDPKSMINMFRVFHHRIDQVEQYSAWIPDLVMAADKYGALTRLKSIFRAIITDEENQIVLSTESKLVISGLADLKDIFAETSEELLRQPLDKFEESIDPELLKLMPDGILEGMRRYRRYALENYQSVIRDLSWRVCTLPREATCCEDLHQSILTFLDSDFVKSILDATSPDEVTLENLQRKLYAIVPGVIEEPLGCYHLQYCENRCNKVAYQLFDAFVTATNDIVYGTHGGCELCIASFRAGRFATKGSRSKI